MLDIVIIGAGPYGLSIAAHLKRQGISFRIFGRLMDSWLRHMPKGMLLKSDGFASNISDPDGSFTLSQFCAANGIPYGDNGIPVRLDTFAAYGVAFKKKIVPELEEKLVASVDRCPDGFLLKLEDGEVIKTRRVVLAVGITHFEYIPAHLAGLPSEYLSHSFRHHHLESFKGRSVVVIGGGASATDIAGSLYEAGAEVKIVARDTVLKFHSKPEPGQRRSLWQSIRHPKSGLGPGLRSRFFSNAPNLFFYFPESLRLKIARRHLGPASGWFSRDKVIDKVQLNLGYTAERAEVQDGKVHLHLRGRDGARTKILADHVIAATGYKVDIDRLTFLNPQIRSQIRAVEGSPVLSSSFESSLPGLYFVGLAATISFGPLMRFAYGDHFAATRLTKNITRLVTRGRAYSPAAQAETIKN